MQRILDAAAQVVEELGYDAATTNVIARRAGTSIGSLYQFFPNKAALMHALAVQYTRELKGLLEKAVAGLDTEGLAWQEIVGKIVDAFADFHATRAGFQAVWFGGHVSADLLQVAFQCGREIARSAEPLLALIAPEMPEERRALVARTATELVGALLMVSTQEKRPEFVAEAKKAVVAYMASAVGVS